MIFYSHTEVFNVGFFVTQFSSGCGRFVREPQDNEVSRFARNRRRKNPTYVENPLLTSALVWGPSATKSANSLENRENDPTLKAPIDRSELLRPPSSETKRPCAARKCVSS